MHHRHHPYVQQPLESLHGHLVQRAINVVAARISWCGIIDKYVQCAMTLLERVDERAYGILIPDVATKEVRIRPGISQQFEDTIAFVFGTTADYNSGSLAAESSRDALAYASRRGRHQRNLAA